MGSPTTDKKQHTSTSPMKQSVSLTSLPPPPSSSASAGHADVGDLSIAAKLIIERPYNSLKVSVTRLAASHFSTQSVLNGTESLTARSLARRREDARYFLMCDNLEFVSVCTVAEVIFSRGTHTHKICNEEENDSSERFTAARDQVVKLNEMF